jgi:hypothetical protein
VWSQVGQGSTFTLKIPAHDVAPPVTELRAARDRQRPPDQPVHERQEANQ